MEIPKSLNKVTLCGQSSLNSDDVSVLSLLYTPLIGKNAFCLYMSMYALLDRNSFSRVGLFHRDIYDILSLTGKDFLEARKRLEGIGLLNAYYKDESFIYVLNSPLSAKQFLADGILGSYLSGEITQDLLDQLITKFTSSLSEVGLDDYQNITVPFENVYKTKDVEPLLLKNKSLISKDRKKRIKVDAQGFFYNIFLEGIDQETFGIGQAGKIKDFVIANAIAFGFSEQEMQRIYKESLINNLFDERKFVRNIKREYTFKTGNESLKLENGDIIDKKLDDILHLSPREILKLAKGSFPTANEVEVVSKLYSAYPDVNKQLINFAVMYVLKTKLQGQNLNYNYMDAVLIDWLGKGISTVSKAEKFLERNNKGSSSTNDRKSSKEPEWVNKGMTNINEGVEEL